MADEYVEVLGELIDLLKDYKPGAITLDNVTKLCQSMGLESFIDELDGEISRLSTASKIIVIDIDYNKVQRRVQDVKLVLASSFDNFDYNNEQIVESQQEGQGQGQKGSNILLNSLTDYDSLQEFHHNLEFLYLLDTYSSVDSDNGTSGNGSSQNASGVSSAANTSTLSDNERKNANDGKSSDGKLNLFKYFRELKKYMNLFFKDTLNSKYKAVANVGNRFGLYIFKSDDYSSKSKPIAKIYFERARDPEQRFYEYIYSPEAGSWINENSENYSVGVNLILEIIDYDETEGLYWFPKELFPMDLLVDSNDMETNRKVADVLSHSYYELGSMNKKLIQLMNDFTTDLIRIKRFNINNDNLDLISDILNWTLWYKIVLLPIYQKLSESLSDMDDQQLGFEMRNSELSMKNRDVALMNPPQKSGPVTTQRASVSFQRRRRSSNKGKRPSILESNVFRDEGLQQFSLHEIMSEPAVEEEETDNLNISGNDDSMAQSFVGTQELIGGNDIIAGDKMDIDEEAVREDSEDSTNMEEANLLIVNEDHISFKGLGYCSFYDGIDKWISYMADLEKALK